MNLDVSTGNLCFDDILLVPKKSNVASRSNINIQSVIGNPDNPDGWLHLGTPIVLAPMDFISTTKMISSITKRGGIAFIQRWQSVEKRFKQLEELSTKEIPNRTLGFALSITEAEDKIFINQVLSFGVEILLIDTAFGHTDVCVDAVKNLRAVVSNNIHLMVGNVSSYEAYQNLMQAGADSVRVGIGGGAACNTRFATGFGVPVLGSVMDIYSKIDKVSVNGIISDGAIKQTGDIVKALAGGASAVMIGSMFAGHEECESNQFRGIASLSLQLDVLEKTPDVASTLHVEGVHGNVEKKGSVEDTLNQMINNIRSGFSYCGATDLKVFRNNCEFIVVSQQSIKESSPRV